jgi:hypothetical protein
LLDRSATVQEYGIASRNLRGQRIFESLVLFALQPDSVTIFATDHQHAQRYVVTRPDLIHQPAYAVGIVRFVTCHRATA